MKENNNKSEKAARSTAVMVKCFIWTVAGWCF